MYIHGGRCLQHRAQLLTHTCNRWQGCSRLGAGCPWLPATCSLVWPGHCTRLSHTLPVLPNASPQADKQQELDDAAAAAAAGAAPTCRRSRQAAQASAGAIARTAGTTARRQPQQQLVAPRVLVAAHTNVAVDRVLLGLQDAGFTDMLRVGSLPRIAKRLLRVSLHSAGATDGSCSSCAAGPHRSPAVSLPVSQPGVPPLCCPCTGPPPAATQCMTPMM